MFIVLISLFNNFYHTFIILFSIVLSTTGIFVGLLVMGMSFSGVMTGLGIVACTGIVVNNNIILIDSYRKIRKVEEDKAVAIIKSALESPIRTIVENSGEEGSVIIQKVKEGKGDYGYNASSGKYESMFNAGIIDPTKVTRLSLENAASISSLLITTECVVVDEPEKEGPVMPPMPPGAGGGTVSYTHLTLPTKA